MCKTRRYLGLRNVERVIFCRWLLTMDLNLDALKEEILRFLDASEFAVFRGHAGTLDELPVITWDSESFPDYRMFLDAAQRSGEKVVIFMTAVFDDEDIADVEADVALSGLDREH